MASALLPVTVRLSSFGLDCDHFHMSVFTPPFVCALHFPFSQCVFFRLSASLWKPLWMFPCDCFLMFCFCLIKTILYILYFWNFYKLQYSPINAKTAFAQLASQVNLLVDYRWLELLLLTRRPLLLSLLHQHLQVHHGLSPQAITCTS